MSQVAIIFDDPTETGLLFPDRLTAEQYDLRGRPARIVPVVVFNTTNADIADDVVRQFAGSSFIILVKEFRARTSAGLNEAKECIRAAEVRAQRQQA